MRDSWLRAVAGSTVESPAEWAVLMALALAAGGPGGVAWPSVATVAAQTRLSRRTVQRSLAALAGRGLIQAADPPEPLPGFRKIRSRGWLVRPDGAAVFDVGGFRRAAAPMTADEAALERRARAAGHAERWRRKGAAR